jgi:hypothetical protein
MSEYEIYVLLLLEFLDSRKEKELRGKLKSEAQR